MPSSHARRGSYKGSRVGARRAQSPRLSRRRGVSSVPTAPPDKPTLKTTASCTSTEKRRSGCAFPARSGWGTERGLAERDLTEGDGQVLSWAWTGLGARRV